MRRYLIGAVASAAVLVTVTVAIGQITNGVPSARQRAGSPESKLAGGWDQKILATGLTALENPTGVFTQYGYLNDAGSSRPVGVTDQASGLKTKTEPDQNTYIVTGSNPGGPQAGYDYGRHFLVQGHELFTSAVSGVGHSNSAYITRINLDVPYGDRHRVTLLAPQSGTVENSGMASLDGSTYDPFSGQLLFTGEAGGNATYGGVYSTALNWTGTAAPAATRLTQSMGYAGYEGIQADDKGSLYLAEDTSGSTVTGTSGVKNAKGYIYRFVPSDPADLTKGVLQALRVSVDGTPLTAANQNPVSGTPDKRLYSGEQLSATWVIVHDSTVASPPSSFDANTEAATANATPFKRPENGRFLPGNGFKSYLFTVTGDTSSGSVSAPAVGGEYVDGSGNKASDRGAFGAIMRIDMPTSGATTATVTAVVLGDQEHTGLDSITFLDKNTVLSGEDRGDGLHQYYNALDSTWSFDLTKSIDQINTGAQRLIGQGRDPESTADVDKKEATPPVADQNDGDNEVTGLLVSDGISTVSNVFGSVDPAISSGTRMFYTGQHGANVTYELLLPGSGSSNASPGVEGPAGQDGNDGANGAPGAPGSPGATGGNGATGPQGGAGPAGPQGATGPAGGAGRAGRDGLTILCRLSGRRVTCSTAKPSRSGRATAARLTRTGRTYARGTMRSMRQVRRVRPGRYVLVLGKGHSARRVKVSVR